MFLGQLFPDPFSCGTNSVKRISTPWLISTGHWPMLSPLSFVLPEVLLKPSSRGLPPRLLESWFNFFLRDLWSCAKFIFPILGRNCCLPIWTFFRSLRYLVVFQVVSSRVVCKHAVLELTLEYSTSVKLDPSRVFPSTLGVVGCWPQNEADEDLHDALNQPPREEYKLVREDRWRLS